MPAQLHLGSRCWSSRHSATRHPAPHALVNLGQFKGKQCLPLACSMEHLPLLGQYAAMITGRCTHCKRATMLVIHELDSCQTGALNSSGDDDGAVAVL